MTISTAASGPGRARGPSCDTLQVIIDALRGSYPSFLGDLAHGHCMPILQEVDLISKARQDVALDQGNDHLHGQAASGFLGYDLACPAVRRDGHRRPGTVTVH